MIRSLTARTVPLIEDALWEQVTRHYLFMRGMTREESRRLRLMASDFLTRKHIVGAAGLEITDLIRAQIAAQACILVLELGIDCYDNWQEIIVYPGHFRPQREYTDAAGVVHTSRGILAGEAWLKGPVILAYQDIARPGDPDYQHAGHNVVIHEFAHKLDMLNGHADGYPPLHKGMSREGWRQSFMAAYLDFCQRADAGVEELPMNSYAAESPAEFFAVISEAFFETPNLIQASYPQVYQQLARFYRQNPLARFNG
ncbi:MAG: zinc-dependent peptidase [Betaproteobacteria bacterium]|nr:zinc-dependent peptidase [Betaproteobacteria bacterium]